jgi:hypothetical protein
MKIIKKEQNKSSMEKNHEISTFKSGMSICISHFQNENGNSKKKIEKKKPKSMRSNDIIMLRL